MRFPSRMLAANMWFAAMLWAAFVAAVAVITTAVAIFGTVNRSAWESASQIPRWYALFVGVALVREFLPLYIAHGQTRRQFGAQATATVLLFAPFLSALIVAGYLLEKGLYALAGWPQALTGSHLFAQPTQVHLVFLEHLVEFAVWIAAGAFMGAAFYRWRSGGLYSLPIGVGLLVLVRSAGGDSLRLPLVRSELGLDLSTSLTLTTAVGVGAFLVGLALTWLVIRDVPLRNQLT